MTTRQAVWPLELIERRSVATRLDARIRDLSRRSSLELHGEIARLRAERAALPCPHFDVTPLALGTDEWICDDCRQHIGPAWVPLAEQESHLRRAGSRLPAA